MPRALSVRPRAVEGQRPLLEAMAQVVRHAGQCPPAQRFDAQLLQQLEHQALAPASAGAQAARAAPHRTASAAAPGRRPRRETSRSRRSRSPGAGAARTAAGAADRGAGGGRGSADRLAAQRADGGGAQLLDLLLPARELLRLRSCQCGQAVGLVEVAVEGSAGSTRPPAVVRPRRTCSGTTGGRRSAGSRKISMFSAQVMTVRGDISVRQVARRRSPCASGRPSPPSSAPARTLPSPASAGTRASTMAISSSAGR